MPRLGSSKARKAGLIAAGSVAGLTAGSAGSPRCVAVARGRARIRDPHEVGHLRRGVRRRTRAGMSAMRRSSTSPDGRRSGRRSTARVRRPRRRRPPRAARLAGWTPLRGHPRRGVRHRVVLGRVLTLDAVVLLSRPRRRRRRLRPPRPLLPGRRGLAEAVRRIEEGEEALAEARRLRQSGEMSLGARGTAGARSRGEVQRRG